MGINHDQLYHPNVRLLGISSFFLGFIAVFVPLSFLFAEIISSFYPDLKIFDPMLSLILNDNWIYRGYFLFFVTVGLFSFPSVIVGFIARKMILIDKKQEKQIATAGIVLAILGICIASLLCVFTFLMLS